MGAGNRALAWENLPSLPEISVRSGPLPAFPETLEPSRRPAMRVVPLLRSPQPRGFVRVPTYAVGVYVEQREAPRACLRLPLKLRSVAGVLEDFQVSLVTRDVSASGVYFLCPKPLEAGAEIELDIVLVSRPLGYGNVVVSSNACVRRIEPANMPGWFGVGASFTDFAFDRDDRIPNRYAAD